jgi:hypothetical protein
MSDNRNPATAVNSGEVGGDDGDGAGSFLEPVAAANAIWTRTRCELLAFPT